MNFVRLHEKDGCLVLSLNRPPLNILNIEMMDEISNALAEVRQNTSARVLLLRGEGRCFSAGMDISDHLPGKVEEMLRAMHRMFECLSDIEIPTICVVQGSALGGGLEIAAFADITIAQAGAMLGVPEIKLGVFPPVAVAFFANLIGLKKTYEIVLTGRTFSAEEALAMGLLNAVHSNDQLQSQVDALVAELTALSRPVLIATKKALREASGKQPFEALSEAERIYMEDVMTSLDASEGLRAFLEKRPPTWKNR